MKQIFFVKIDFLINPMIRSERPSNQQAQSPVLLSSIVESNPVANSNTTSTTAATITASSLNTSDDINHTQTTTQYFNSSMTQSYSSKVCQRPVPSKNHSLDAAKHAKQVNERAVSAEADTSVSNTPNSSSFQPSSASTLANTTPYTMQAGTPPPIASTAYIPLTVDFTMSAATIVAPNHHYTVYPTPMVSIVATTTVMHSSEQPLDVSAPAWTNNQAAGGNACSAS